MMKLLSLKACSAIFKNSIPERISLINNAVSRNLKRLGTQNFGNGTSNDAFKLANYKDEVLQKYKWERLTFQKRTRILIVK